MGGDPPGDVTHAERELDALRRRAYGPDADILDDAPALSRLLELEDRVQRERLVVETGRVPLIGAVIIQTAPARVGTPRRHGRLLAGMVAAVLLIGASASSETEHEPTDTGAAGTAETAAVADYRGEAGYQRYLGSLRDAVLALPGSERIATRVIRDQLRPYGTLYGRIVGSGPTIDHKFCMIVADLPAASVTCISVENAYANPVSVILPSLHAGSASDQPAAVGQLVSYTLMPGGSVVALPVAPQ